MKLKDALGKPGEGIHFHVGGIAIMDVLMTIAFGCLIGWFDGSWATAILAIGVLFAIGETLHLFIGVDTTVAKWLKREQ